MGSPQQQQDMLQRYFLSDASFIHPLCHVPSFSRGAIPFAWETDSRRLILALYRWYRILSPRIQLHIESAAFDQRNNLLYLSIHQVFSLWSIPFCKADVNLVTILRLAQRPEAQAPQERLRYYISRQEDLYQTNDLAKFVTPRLAPLLVCVLQLLSMAFCVVGSIILSPVYRCIHNFASVRFD